MTFQKIIVAIDGSEWSEIAAQYAFWLANTLSAKVAVQHIVDPRIADLFLAPEFAEELGFKQAIDSSEKIMRALKKIGNVIVELFVKEAQNHSLSIEEKFIDVGEITTEIINRSLNYDLTIVGHRGRGHTKFATDMITGSVAERVASRSPNSVLIAVVPFDKIETILVAYDGSEISKQILIKAERLAVTTHKQLKVLHVVPTKDEFPMAKQLLQEAATFLCQTTAHIYTEEESMQVSHSEHLDKVVFVVYEGEKAKTMLDFARIANSLLVLGISGMKADKEILSSTVIQVIRETKSSVLIYRQL